MDEDADFVDRRGFTTYVKEAFKGAVASDCTKRLEQAVAVLESRADPASPVQSRKEKVLLTVGAEFLRGQCYQVTRRTHKNRATQ